MNFSLLSDRRRVLLLLNLLSGGGKGISVSGTSPITLANAVKGKLKKLLQYGKCAVNDGVITCNNGVLSGRWESGLPTDYTQVQYLANGNATGEGIRLTRLQVDFSKDFYAAGDFEILSYARQFIFGNYVDGQELFFNFELDASGRLRVYIKSDGGPYNKLSVDPVERNTVLHYTLEYKAATGAVTVTCGDLNIDTTVEIKTGITEQGEWLFRDGRYSTANKILLGKQTFKISEETIYELIPAVNKNNVAGMYDLVSDSFLTNNGLGDFKVGDTVEEPSATIVTTGTAEEVTVTHSDSTTETVSDIPNLYAIDSLMDEHDIITGKTIRRTEAKVYDSANPPTGRFIGDATDGSVIIEARETVYEDDAVVTFTADGENPLNLVKAEFSPIQDLHGYDSPWPAGGGANKLAFSSNYEHSFTQGVIVTAQKDTSELTMTGTLTGSLGNRFGNYAKVTLSAGTYTLSCDVEAGIGEGIFVYNLSTSTILARSNKKASASFTLTEETTVSLGINFPLSVTAGTYHFQLEEGSAATPWKPYSNECPIEGLDEVDLEITGDNLLDLTVYNGGGYNPSIGSHFNLSVAPSNKQFVDNGDGTFSLPQTSSTWQYFTLLFKKKANVAYHRHIELPRSGNRAISYGYLDEDFNVTYRNSNTTSGDITIDDNMSVATTDTWLFITLTNRSSSSIVITIKNPQITIGTTYTGYVAHKGQTTALTFPTTVYGGTVEGAEDGPATVNVTSAYVEFNGSEDWTEGSGNATLAAALPGRYGNGETRDIYGISNYFPSINNHINASWARTTSTNGNALQIRDYQTRLGVADLTAFKALLAETPLQIAYWLATPTPFALPSIEALKTFVGTNNIFSSANGSLSVAVGDPVVEQNTPQPIRLSEGTNTITVTANVEGIQFDVLYKGNQPEASDIDA